jgi:type VI secretion system secreted protein VgrG
MSQLTLSFESNEGSLSVRRFAVHEAMSSLFSVSVWARSPDDDLDTEAFVGRQGSFALASGMLFALLDAQRWTGVVSHMEQLQAESTGLSTYYLRVVPRLWLLTQRRNHRLFQHLSIPDIADKLLREWDIPHVWRVRRAEHPKLDLRSQYGESDYDFLCRLLEEAGIAFFFQDDPKQGSTLILSDAPQSAEPRSGGPLRYVDNPSASAEREYVTHVRFAQQVRPGKVTLRDHDFRRHPQFGLFGHKGAGHSVEDGLEIYQYSPGQFLHEVDPEEGDKHGHPSIVEEAKKALEGVLEDEAGSAAKKQVGDRVKSELEKVTNKKLAGVVGDVAGGLAGKVAKKVAGAVIGAIGKLAGDDKGMARFTEKAGMGHAERRLDAMRAGRQALTFETNAYDLAPGAVFSILGHARAGLGPDRKLLVVERSVEGTHDGEWTESAQAFFAEQPYRPAARTPKPSIQGLQSALVVGPHGEEIHTDEHGRVRVQFHWDREGTHDDRSSCWMRVSQGWAGPGYGLINLPRVGHEVLVAFLEGDPDHPVVIGRLFNATHRTPYTLPEHKTKSGWRSDTTPGSGGFNEIMFEDAKGHELVNVQAERDLEKLVKHDERIAVGHDRRTTVGDVDETHVGMRHNVTMKHHGEGGPTYQEMVDKRIHFSTGEASITLDGPNITLQAKGRIFIHSSDDDVEILGGPWVKINCGPAKDESDTVTMHHITGILKDQDDEPLAGHKVVIKANDGSIQQVETDASGRYFGLVPPGKCSVSLPGGFHYGSKGPNLDHMSDEPEEFDDCGPVR